MSNRRRSVLFVGQCYYNAWYLSRELRKMGWRADVLNWDGNQPSQIYYHGEDFKFRYEGKGDILRQWMFYFKALAQYDVFHFSNRHGITFGGNLNYGRELLHLSPYAEIRFLKKLGKKIVYTNNGCCDGVSQSSFSSWPGENPCEICTWRNVPAVCGDENNLNWGKARNSLADYQCYLGGNRKDYNEDATVHEVPEFYCLDTELWKPDLDIPPKFRLNRPTGTINLYHAVGNFDIRSDKDQRNIKSTHVYLPLVERLKKEGYPVELFFAKDVPNRDVRYYQAQADIVLDMLSFGFFGANAREGMMLGKPVVCYLRPEWLRIMEREIPEYVKELPIISATPETVYEVITDLIKNPRKRAEIGKRGRAFAEKWHSSSAGAKRLDKIYCDLLKSK